MGTDVLSTLAYVKCCPEMQDLKQNVKRGQPTAAYTWPGASSYCGLRIIMNVVSGTGHAAKTSFNQLMRDLWLSRARETAQF